MRQLFQERQEDQERQAHREHQEHQAPQRFQVEEVRQSAHRGHRELEAEAEDGMTLLKPQLQRMLRGRYPGSAVDACP